MTAQSVAEAISSGLPNLKILLIAMNGRESAEYVRETPVCIDSVKFHIDNKMISGEEFLKTCTHKGNFYYMAGICNETEARYYHPDMAEYLLEELSPEFDLLIADCGNELDNGLAIGTMGVSEEILFIITQQESVLGRYEKNKKLMDELNLKVSGFVVNQYSDQNPYGLSYIAERLEIEKEKLIKIEASGYSRQAEIDKKTLLEYGNEAYSLDITALANNILRKNGFPEIEKKRKSRWKRFI